MANPTTQQQTKPIAFTVAAGFGEKVFFEVFNVNTGETIRKDSEGKRLRTGSLKKGVFDADWLTASGWETGHKLIVSVAGKAYGSSSVTLTARTAGSQKLAATITAVTTALPALNM